MAKDNAAFKRLTRLKAAGWPLSADCEAAIDDIVVRRPKWTPAPGDRDDFSVWHESGWRSNGQPELSAADPERALRALKLEADVGRFEPVAWRVLLCAASDKGDPGLQFDVADALLTMPAAALGELLEPAASWLQRHRESLKGDPPDETTFLRVWDRLATLAYPQDVGPIEEEIEGDLISTALNNSAGMLASTLLNHIEDQDPAQNSELRPQFATRLNVAINAGGRAGLLARVEIVRSLADLESIDPNWAATNLVSCLSWERPHAAAMWDAFTGGGRIGTPRLFNDIKAPVLEAFTRPDLGDHAREALIGQLLRIEFAHRRGKALDYSLTSAELKRALSVAAPSVRATAARLLWLAMDDEQGEPDKAVRWRQVVGPIFRDIWPLDARFRDKQVSERLVLMTLECEDAFDDAVDAVIDFIVPYQFGLIAHSLRLQQDHDKLLREHPRAALKLADALIDPAIYPVPNDLADFLQLCVDADPSVTADATYIRLFGLRRLQSA